MPAESDLRSREGCMKFHFQTAARAAEPDAARALIKVLTAPAAMPVIKSKGMEPPG